MLPILLCRLSITFSEPTPHIFVTHVMNSVSVNKDGLCFHVPQHFKSWKTSVAMYIYQETIPVLVDLGLQYLEREEEVGIAKWGELQISPVVRTFSE